MIAREVISKLIDCDDFHEKKSCTLDHTEITYLLDYIYYLEEQNELLQEISNDESEGIDEDG